MFIVLRTYNFGIPSRIFLWKKEMNITQYGHSQFEKKWMAGDKYYLSIKVHTYEAQNLHQLKFPPLSDLTSYFFQKLLFAYEVNLTINFA